MANPSNQPLYQKIKEDILQKLKENLLKPGDKLPTEQQFMEQYSVSRITVSKALNELKNEGIIVRYPNKGTFISESVSFPSLVREVPAPAVAITSASAAMTEIACIIPTMDDLFSLTLINGVLAAFPEESCVCHIFQSRTPEIENYLLQRCMDLNIAGIVLFPQSHLFFSDQILAMQLQKYPLVLLDRYLPRLDTSYVIADHKAAGALCIQHLHDLGHQRIAFVTMNGGDTFVIRQRIAGIMEAAHTFGYTEHAIQIVEKIDIRKRFPYYQELFLNMIVQNRVTAFITSESNVCSYLYNLLEYIGFRVPSQISLMSFDRPVNSQKNPDFFTHINQSEFLMGREAGTILKNRIEQNDMNVYHRVITPTLNIHESTKPVVL